MFPPEEKKRPEPVITTDLQEVFAITSCKHDRNGSKCSGEKVFEEAAGDKVTTTTPPSSMSVETGMMLEQGPLY